MGTDPLTAPPAREHASMEPDWSGATASAAHVPLQGKETEALNETTYLDRSPTIGLFLSVTTNNT